ncbi:MAG: PPC domain-containing protein, partial [Promethearchaeota archaeon]
VEPLITFDLTALTPLHTQSECSISLRVKVLGVGGDWNSTLDVQVLSPVGTLLGSMAVQLTADTTEIIRFAADEAGTYYVNCTVYDLPVLGQMSHLMAMNVVYPPILMQLDAGTTPVIGGVGVLLLIGAVFWKKMDSLMSSIPTDWSS